MAAALPGRTESSPVVVRGRVLVGCECGDAASRLAPRTGRIIWDDGHRRRDQGRPGGRQRHRLRRRLRRHGAAVRVAGGGVKWSAGSQERRLSGTGQLLRDPGGRLRPRLQSATPTGGSTASRRRPATSPGASPPATSSTRRQSPRTPPTPPPTVYVGSYDGTFYAIDARSGDIRWQQDAGGGVSGAASLIGHTVYVANLAKTRTIGFNIVNGKRVFAFRDGAYNPIISDGRLLYLTGRKQIYAAQAHRQDAAARASSAASSAKPHRGSEQGRAAPGSGNGSGQQAVSG